MMVAATMGLFAQKNAITGIVYDNSTKEIVQQASIRILNAKDSLFVTGGNTNDKGRFSVSVNPGRYILRASFLGYKDAFLNVNATKNPTDVGNVFLLDDGILLGEALVVGKAPEVVVKGDTIEYNADSYKVQQSAVVEDLVKKMPGAEVDENGKITINGKEVKKILVDGKEFFSSDPKVASKNLPANMVDKLQVLDRKSDMSQMTGFDDGEDETVINLTVKKGMKQGLFGNATAGAGSEDRYGLSGTANYMRNENQVTLIAGSNNTNNEGFTDGASSTFSGFRGGGRGMNFGGRNGITKSSNLMSNFALNPSTKLKWGGNLRLGESNNDVESNLYEERYNKTANQYEQSNSVGNNESQNIGADLRFEWAPNAKTKIIFSPSIQYGENTNWQKSNSSVTLLNPADTINWGNNYSYSEGTSYNGSGKLDISREFNKKGRVLSFSFSGGFNSLDNNRVNKSQTNYTDAESLVIDRIIDQQNTGYNMRAYVSFVEPIGKSNYLQFNYAYRKNYSESDARAFSNDGNGDYTLVDTTATKKLENNFVNQEIGLNFKSVRQKYNYTAGFALQPSSSESKTFLANKDSRVSNDVMNFAPVFQFNYLWDKRRNLRLDYNGSTTQPTTTQLSDVRDESNPNSITYGNPNLKPTFNNRFRLRLQNFNPESQRAFMMFGGFNFSTNDIVTKTYTLDGGRRETTYGNINGNWGVDLRVIFNRPLRNKKFTISSMSYGGYTQRKGFLDGDENMSRTTSLVENVGIQYRSSLFDAGVRGNINYSATTNTFSSETDRTIYRYGGIFTTTWYLPGNVSIDSDMNYIGSAGTTNGYKQNEWIWNASASLQMLKAKTGTLKFNIYDILQQRTNISQSSTSSSFTETRTSTLNPYFMLSFIYRFQFFKGGAKQADMQQNMDSGPGMGRPRGSGRPDGGRPMGM